MSNLKDRLTNLGRRKPWLCAALAVTLMTTVLAMSIWPAYSQSNEWLNTDNWDRLEEGMSKEEVREILGEPRSTRRLFWSGDEIWRYGGIIPHKSNRMVSFNSDGELTGWIVPSFWLM